MIIEPSSRDNINGKTSSSSSLSPTTTRFQQQQQQQYYHHRPVRDDREVEQQQYESQPRSRRINKERVEQDMNLVYTCSRKISDTLTTHTKHDELPHIDALIDTTKRMLHTLDDAKEQCKTIISSNTSPNFSSPITNTTANLDHYHSQQQQQTILSSSPSSPSPTPKSLTSQQLQRQQQPKRAREHSANTTKQCHSCQSTETPEWRKGPMGPRTLFWAKLARQQGISEGPDEEMAATIIATSPSSTTSSRNTSSIENNEGTDMIREGNNN
ncbi:hypothetical protein INT45_003283 [Circinella minor]|uniref:GATA-type domain-containing protein n=1 Tax=Circinella minor TaxID=1195481 RepID=A0A8H7VQJ0_9FUNG|nr:hypothetical protein INT45_003283 [Circinella minor]